MKSLLITGGCGFIGTNFIRLLLRERNKSIGHGECERIVNLDALTYAGNPSNLSDLESEPRYRFVHGDIRDQALVESILRNDEVDTIVHFAAESHVDRSIDSPEPFVQTNALGSMRLFEAARSYWQSLSGPAKDSFRFINVSTDEVYGTLEPEDEPFCETTPYAPNSPYAASKAAGDWIARAYGKTYGLPVITTNCSNNYGPYQFPEKLVPLMILNALEGRPLPVYGDGKQIRDWLFVDDHCAGIIAAAKRGEPGQTYCIGGRSEMQNIQIVRRVCATLDEMRPLEGDARRNAGGARRYEELITRVSDRPGHDRRYAINCDRIERECGWAPEETFDSGIRRTVSWYLENETWCREISESKYRRGRLGLIDNQGKSGD